MATLNHINLIWIKWTLYFALGELLGVGIGGAIVFAVHTKSGEPETLLTKLAVLSIMMIAGFIEGFLPGRFSGTH